MRGQQAQHRLLETVTRMADRLEIIDALYRFAAGQDLRDIPLFTSAFAADAELDFVQPAAKFGVHLPVFEGCENITASIFAAIAELDTTHTVTNTRVEINKDQASLFALVEAQHLPRMDHSNYLLLKNFYWVQLRRTEKSWVITHMRIQNVWHSGDPRVLFPE